MKDKPKHHLDRRAEALKANLGRRKAQQREREGAAPIPASAPAPVPASDSASGPAAPAEDGA